MTSRPHWFFRLAVWCAAIMAPGVLAPAQTPPPPSVPGGPTPAGAVSPPPGQVKAPTLWPRTFSKDGNVLVLYQPQIDSWANHTTMVFRAAFSIVTSGSTTMNYGVVTVQGQTLVDDSARSVLITNMQPTVVFPGMSDTDAAPLKTLAVYCLSGLSYPDVSLDQVLAYMHGKTPIRKADVNLAPPPIYYSDVPAILVVYVGPPQFKPVAGTKLMFAVNTNWAVFMDMSTSQYYLLDGNSWLTSPDPLLGPWQPALSLPADLSNLPAGGNWENVSSHVPGASITAAPRVITSTTPAELIVTQGAPDYTPIPGTRLMYISNPQTPLFLDLNDSNYYFLVAGRWFRSPSPNGPWTAASADLPAEFAKIPKSSPMAFVLASVPKTQEAEDAVLLAQVPHQATINIKGTTVNVTYDGAPKFEPIPSTTMTYATNTAYQVVGVDGVYYCCYNGVWFTSPAAAGPWVVCTSVPQVIYTIPASSPLYNCTYVQVYSSTPTTVVYGYTGGYTGEYVAATGALMFGAGMVTGAILASNNGWYSCPPCYYSYGCAAHYSYAYGGYYRAGGSYYGPCGGAGWGASYNPSTGTYARAGAAYGPDGAHWGAQAYNPYTNTYAQHTGGTNGYSSWGSSYASNGSQSAQASHESTARGGVGEASNSSGQWAEGAHSNALNSSVAKTSNGDTYASHDGNVYKNTGSGWQKYNGNGSWSDTSTPHSPSSTPSASSWGDTQKSLNSDSWSRSQGNSNSASSWQSRSSDGSYGDRSSGWGDSNSSSGWGDRSGGDTSSGWGSDRSSSGGGWGDRSSSSGGGWGDHSSGGWGGDHSWGGGGWGGGGWGDHSGGFGGGGRSFGGWGGGGGRFRR